MNRHNDETFLKKQEKKINMELLKEKGNRTYRLLPL